MKNPKLEAAQRRLFNGRTVLPHAPFDGPYRSGLNGLQEGDGAQRDRIRTLKMVLQDMDANNQQTERLQAEVNALQELLNEKDELIDKLQRPMVIRMDWWLVGLVVTVLIAHGLGQI